MTPDKPKPHDFDGGYQIYSESGVDLTLLDENLKKTIEERLEENRRAALFAETLRLSLPPGKRHPVPPVRRQAMFDPEALIRRLSEHKVEFVLIGGMAMIVHGSAAVTKDLDLCYRRTPENIAALAAALAGIHPYLRGAPEGLPFRFDPPTIHAGLNFTLITDQGDVDLLGEVSGVGAYEQALIQSEEREMYGVTVHILSLDGLIAAKKAAGRAKDHTHLHELEDLKKRRDAAQ
jgi:predicted nucleotidyltransferase